MRKVRTPSRLFAALRLYFEDLREIDKICLDALTLQSLLPCEPAPIRIERFVEKQFKAPLRYEDLGPEKLGCTIFNSSGTVEAILPARGRLPSTIAHKAGHGLLHGSLFIEGNSADLLNGSLGEKQRRILSRTEDILVDTWRSYVGRWWEFQANQAIGRPLLPRFLLNHFMNESGIKLDSFGSPILSPAQREALVKRAAVTFDVNPIVIRIRLDLLFPQGEREIAWHCLTPIRKSL